MIINQNNDYFQFMDINLHENPSLREPQLHAYNRVFRHFITDEKTSDSIVILPTGVGKTGLMGIIPFGISQGRVLIITPQLTIKDTVLDSLNPDNPNNFWLKRDVISDYEMLPVVIDYRKDLPLQDLSKANFVIANIHKLQERLDSSLLNQVPSDFFDMIIIDEAHHSPAETWQTTLDYFINAKVVKLTGTPFRSDSLKITGDLTFKYKLSQAMANNYVKSLRNIHYVPNDLKLTLDNDESRLYTIQEVYDELGKNDDWISRSVAYSQECSMKIVEESIELLNTKKEDSEVPHKIIAVACTIDHANSIEKMYINKGLRTTIVHSKLDSTIKTANLSDIKNNRVDVVINVAMLGEGYDHPYLSIAAIFRPFRNPLPYAQFIGRILRRIDSEHFQIIPSDNIGEIISHKYMFMEDLWEFYREQINECDTIRSLNELDLDDIIINSNPDAETSNETRDYDVSIGGASEVGRGTTITETYLNTELIQEAARKSSEEQEKALELAKTLDTSVDEALKILKRLEFSRNNKFKRPELLLEYAKKDINILIREQYVPELLNKFQLDTKRYELCQLPLLRGKYVWLKKGDQNNGAILAIYFNQALKDEIGLERKKWNNDDSERAYDYLTGTLYPFVKNALASFTKL